MSENTKELDEAQVIARSEYYNMRKVCEEAGVSYETWRKYKCGYQGMSPEKIEAIGKAMDRI